MTFNENADISGSRVRRGGGGRRGAVAVGGVGALVLALVGMYLGLDLSALTGGTMSSAPATGEVHETLEQCHTGADANTDIECRMQAAALSLDAYWEEVLPAQAQTAYVLPEFEVFTGSTQTACGGATSAVGPFYCPADQTVYLDVEFFDDLTTRFGANDASLAQMYVVAHEFGHHISHQLGYMSRADRSGAGPTSDGVRLELQADCYAGMWVRGAAQTTDDAGVAFLQPPTREQIADALSAASAVGDDRIQSSAGGQVNPETWTHGSSEQRQRWFLTGYNQNSLESCDAFAVSGAQL